MLLKTLCMHQAHYEVPGDWCAAPVPLQVMDFVGQGSDFDRSIGFRRRRKRRA